MNKYAESYLDSIKKYIDNVKWHLPLAGVTAGLGAGAGAVSGLINPEKDEEGEKQRLKSVLKGMAKGTAIGGGAGILGAAVIANPHVGRELGRKMNRSTWNKAPLSEKIFMSIPPFKGSRGPFNQAPFWHDLNHPRAKNFFN